MHAESHIDIRQRGHAVLGKLFLNSPQKSSIDCPILFVVPAKCPHSERRAKTAPQLFVLPEHLQTALESEHDNGEPGFLDLLLQPIRNIVGIFACRTSTKCWNSSSAKRRTRQRLSSSRRRMLLLTVFPRDHSGSPS